MQKDIESYGFYTDTFLFNFFFLEGIYIYWTQNHQKFNRKVLRQINLLTSSLLTIQLSWSMFPISLSESALCCSVWTRSSSFCWMAASTAFVIVLICDTVKSWVWQKQKNATLRWSEPTCFCAIVLCIMDLNWLATLWPNFMTPCAIFTKVWLFTKSETRSSHRQTKSDAYEPTMHTHRSAQKSVVLKQTELAN